MKPIIQVMRSPFVEVQREAGRCLGNLAANRANHRFIIDEGGHQVGRFAAAAAAVSRVCVSCDVCTCGLCIA